MKKLAMIFAASFGAVACAADGDPAASKRATVVDAPRARQLVAAGVRVVDVRTKAEFDAGHVPGAVNIPFDELERRAGEVGPPSQPVLLYCRTGRRSAIAGETLRKLGFTELYDLQAYDRWVASGRAQRDGDEVRAGGCRAR